jgi:hypothetical protein
MKRDIGKEGSHVATETPFRCQVCVEDEPGRNGCVGKYRCPRCGLRYGRVACFQRHEVLCTEQGRSKTGARCLRHTKEPGCETARHIETMLDASGTERLQLIGSSAALILGQLSDEGAVQLQELQDSVSHQKERICSIVDPVVDRTVRLERLSLALCTSAEFATFAERLLQFIGFRSRYDDRGSDR